jgi:hypothetical protein
LCSLGLAQPESSRVVIDGARANELAFPATEARAVRLRILATNSDTQACLDELEVYGPDGKANLARAKGVKTTASSCLAGYEKHRTPHLTDGEYGNDHSWIAATNGTEWAQLDFPEPVRIDRVVFSRDRKGQYGDRVPMRLTVDVSADGVNWQTVRRVSAHVVATVRPGSFRGVVGAPPPAPQPGQKLQDSPAGLEARKRNVYGLPNLALRPEAQARASSCLPGHAIHKVEHLNEGKTGNSHSWIANEMPAWAEIDLNDEFWVSQVGFGNDASNTYRDRAPEEYEIAVSLDSPAVGRPEQWQTVFRGTEPVLGGARDIHLRPVRARRVRIRIQRARGGMPRIDEIEIFGQADPIPADKHAPPTESSQANGKDAMLQQAFLGEEHAWLKVAGHADLSSRLVPYNGRVKEYPHHAPPDILPLPTLPDLPELDGKLNDDCWERSSRGVARVAFPYDFDLGPLVETSVQAAIAGDQLLLGIQTNRLLSAHLAVVSTMTGAGCGVVCLGSKGGEFRTFERVGRNGAKLLDTKPLTVYHNDALTEFELALPLAWFKGWQDEGLRIGLGMGGRHTAPEGRAVCFVPADGYLREIADAESFVIEAGNTGTQAMDATVKSADDASRLQLAPGKPQRIPLPLTVGPIGPERQVEVSVAGASCRLRLFRYDPCIRVRSDLAKLLPRLNAKGVATADIERDVEALADAPSSRNTFFQLRLLKRRAYLRDPDLAPLQHLLFAKRHPFHPSHNYSVVLDSPWRPGGAICTLDLPWQDSALDPSAGRVTRLFEAEKGVARTPMATFDGTRIYFAYRPARDDYFRIMTMAADGTGLRQLTNGPFHDFWPCPLPDGGLAFISTRCRARFLCWRPQAFVLFRMNPDGSDMRPLSYANLSEWAPSVMSDGRLIWTRSEYVDKGADFSHTLWAIRPDGTKPELVFGNTIIQPNGYANGREVPGTHEICATMISHFGDLNGPIALLDIDKGRFTKEAITSLTPEVPWPGMWPMSECFRDPVPISRDHILCAHAPQTRFGLYVIDRYGNREVLHLDPAIDSVCPTLLRPVSPPPVLASLDASPDEDWGTMALADVYRGIPQVERGRVKYLRIACEVRAGLNRMPDGSYQKDHTPFQHWYAGPVDRVSGPFGWPSYVAKGSYGLVPVEADGSAHFKVPAGRVIYLQALDKDLNELQRMRSVVQLQPGEKRSCIGCHEDRRRAPQPKLRTALLREADAPEAPPWGAGPFAYEKVVQPVLDRGCVRCHNATHPGKLDLTGTLDQDRIPASYKTLIRKGLVHYLDWGYNSGGNEKREALTFGTLKSKLFKTLEGGHHKVKLAPDEMRALKCWVDLNCPLWPDYQFRDKRPGPAVGTQARAH